MIGGCDRLEAAAALGNRDFEVLGRRYLNLHPVVPRDVELLVIEEVGVPDDPGTLQRCRAVKIDWCIGLSGQYHGKGKDIYVIGTIVATGEKHSASSLRQDVVPAHIDELRDIFAVWPVDHRRHVLLGALVRQLEPELVEGVWIRNRHCQFLITHRWQ